MTSLFVAALSGCGALDNSAGVGGGESVGEVQQGLANTCGTATVSATRTGWVTPDVRSNQTTGDSYGTSKCPDAYRIDLNDFAGGTQAVDWGAARSLNEGKAACGTRKLTVDLWDRSTNPPTFVESRSRTGTTTSSTQCLTPELRLDGWLTKDKDYRIAVRAETTKSDGTYTLAPITFRSSNITRCATTSSTGCWRELQQPARYPIAVGQNVACWVSPGRSTDTITCYKPSGNSGFSAVSVGVGSADQVQETGEPNWTQIPRGTVSDMAFVPFVAPSDWTIPTGSNPSSDYILYVLINGDLYRASPGQPPTGSTGWVYLQHHWVSFSKYVASGSICQIQYINSPGITGLRARRCAPTNTLARTTSVAGVTLWEDVAMPSGWPATIDDLSGNGSNLMWGRKGQTVYQAGSSTVASGAIAAIPGTSQISLQDGLFVSRNTGYDCEVNQPGNVSGVLSGRMSGTCMLDLYRFLRYSPSSNSWSYVPGHTGPWDVDPGSGVPTAPLEIQDAQRFRNRAGEMFMIHNFSRFLAYIP
jgi:hypothetical protein